MKRIVPLAIFAFALSAAADPPFPGARIPGTSGSNLDTLPTNESGNQFSTGGGSARNVQWAKDWFLAFDGDTVSFPNITAVNTIKLDAGTPRTLSGIRVMTWSGANNQANAYKNLSFWGSADGTTWTELGGQGGQTMSYGTWVSYTPASAGPFRYFEIRSCALGWITEAEFYSADDMVETMQPVAWADASLGAADRAGGVRFSGTLAHAAAGSAEVVVYVANKDFGDDAAAWAANGSRHSAGTVASGASWTLDVPLQAGLWHARAFAVSGGGASASQRTETFAVGATPVFPPAYVSYGGSSKARFQYDGDVSTHGDENNANWIVLDVRNLVNAAGKEIRPVSLKLWAGLNAQVPYLAWLWARGTVVEASWDDAAWSGTALSGVTQRTVSQASDPGVTWTRVADATGNTEILSQVYEVALPDSFLRKPPKFLRVRNVTLSYLAEVEVRALRPSDGTVVLVK